MKRLLAAAILLTACSTKPCRTSNDCGASEVCAAARCLQLSCDAVYSAVDPATGECRPMPACGNRDDVRAWVTCDDPCKGVGEFICVSDPRCQPVYASDATSAQPCAFFGASGGIPPLPAPLDLPISQPTCVGGSRAFLGCRPNPLRVDPCAGLAEPACSGDARCVYEMPSIAPCNCPVNMPCRCAAQPAAGECRRKTCSEHRSAAQCTQDPECQAGTPAPACPPGASCLCPAPFRGNECQWGGCSPRVSGTCLDFDEATCLAHPECHPVGTPCFCPANTSCACTGGHFLACEADDGLKRCDRNSDCGGDERCDNDEACAPPNAGGTIASGVFLNGSPGGPVPAGTPASTVAPMPPSCTGVCVAKGCIGDGEQDCNADPTCQPIYSLNCSPYGGANATGFAPCGAGGLPPSPGPPGVQGCACEPTFQRCLDAKPGSVVDPGRSVLLLDPGIVDDPSFAFESVMAQLSGVSDPAAWVERWFGQITSNVTVNTRTALPRQGASQYFAGLPRRSDGHLDLAKIGFQVTSLSNRIDLATTHDCGEARITYALAGGATDRQNRMTIIVELGQPEDGANCAGVARRWVALSKLSGGELLAAVKAIYAPLLAPVGLHQIRTNEFLVGPVGLTGNVTWELREWHLGSDGDLHLAPSKQAVSPADAATSAFTAWALSQQAGILDGSAQIPAQFLSLTSSETGERIRLLPAGPPPVDLSAVEDALHQSSCAGCHTNATNTAFAQVAERFGGNGRAKISEFLRKQVPIRAQNLWQIAQGQLSYQSRFGAHPIH